MRTWRRWRRRARRPRVRSRRARAAPGAKAGSLPPLGLEHVSRLADGLDQRRPGGVEFPAQVADVGLDDVGVAAEVVAPHVLEDLRLGEHAPRVEEEIAQKRE